MADRSEAPLSDPGRLAAARSLQPDQGASAAFDRLAHLAAVFLDVPAASVSIVEEQRQRFIGVASPGFERAGPRETPIEYSYCQHVVTQGSPLLLEDATKDPQFCTHPACVEGGIAAYIGIPIRTSAGHVIGALCAFDLKPREWTDAQLATLTDLAASVVTEIELRQELTERARAEAARAASEAHYRRLVEGIPQGVYILDTAGRFTELNESAEHILGRTETDLIGRSFEDVIATRELDAVRSRFVSVVSGAADDIEFETWVARPTGEERLLVVTASAMQADGAITGLYGIARDVTEEREADLALRRSEERFREIALNVRDVFWTFTPDFSRMLYMSPSYDELFGQSRDSLREDGRSFLERVHPEDRERLMGAMNRVAEAPVTGVEYRVVRGDGTSRWVRARGYPVHDDSNTVVRVVGTLEDITERKSTELALQESERTLRQILDALPVGAVLAEPPGRLVWHNAAADRIWGGVRPAGPEGWEHYRAYHTDSGLPLDPLEWPLARALMGEEVSDTLIDIETFDGRRCTTLHCAVPIRNAEGEVTAAIAVIEDVTDARARDAEQRLLAAALEGLSEGIMLVKPDGEIVYANETFAHIMGVPPDRVAGLRLSDFARSNSDAREQREQIACALEHGRWSGRVRRPRLSDRVEVPIDLVLGRVEHDGDARLLFGIVQDATAEIEREHHLRRAERLASVGTMIGGVAHELNNPLQAILNYAQLLLLDERTPEDRDALTVMEREAQRMAKIVADLKQIARSTQEESGRRSATDVNDVVNHVMKVQEYLMRTSNIDVRLDLGADLPPIMADRAQLEQVLVNLVVNAAQALAPRTEGRRLIVRTRASALGASLQVVDNGQGIPPHHLQRIFDPFFTTKEPGEGTGLGLSLVHSIVTEHGGEIRVDSEIGSGTAFRLDWPRAHGDDESASLPSGQEPENDRPSLRVLVVDDEQAVRSVVVRYLTRRGHVVDQASDGGAALTMLDSAAYDVILSDLRMPGVGGETMMEQLRDRGLADRVIFMTGDAAGAAARLGDAGVPVLLKPVELAAVAEAVESFTAPP